jgi:hypothetical protein
MMMTFGWSYHTALASYEHFWTISCYTVQAVFLRNAANMVSKSLNLGRHLESIHDPSTAAVDTMRMRSRSPLLGMDLELLTCQVLQLDVLDKQPRICFD